MQMRTSTKIDLDKIVNNYVRIQISIPSILLPNWCFCLRFLDCTRGPFYIHFCLCFCVCFHMSCILLVLILEHHQGLLNHPLIKSAPKILLNLTMNHWLAILPSLMKALSCQSLLRSLRFVHSIHSSSLVRLVAKSFQVVWISFFLTT